jgi:hypothetical protein
MLKSSCSEYHMVTFAGLEQAHILKHPEKCMELFLSKFCFSSRLFHSYELLVSSFSLTRLQNWML